MRFKLTYEFILPFTFLFGILLAHTIPYKLSILTDIAWFFANFFFLFAPIFIFVILSSSLLSRGSIEQGKLANYTMGLFFILCLITSLTSATILSTVMYEGYSGEIKGLGSMEHLRGIIINGLLKPIPLSIFMSIIVSFTIAKRFIFIRSAIMLLNEFILKLIRQLIKVLPIISISFGATFYYNLKMASFIAYIEALLITFGLHILYILMMILLLLLYKFDLKRLFAYTVKTLITGISVPASYILLPMHLKIFSDHFSIDRSLRDFIITSGAALNRLGSITGVIVSIYISALYLNLSINPIQFIILAPFLAIAGFASPGIMGGTILVTMPIIIDILGISDTITFSLTSIALFNGVSLITAGTNAVTTGYTTLIVHNLIFKRT
ncbi:MAG: cation:dicarboxylase symporter family transporter [Nitrososphaerota archaeon]|nr:cation:dicarboxylase symporter family transporter [Nitrososphaerota archaeon]